MNPSDLFRRPMERVDDILYVAPDERPSLNNWDDLAANHSPIHAAISQDDESGELKKGAHEYETILKEVPSGVLLDLGCGYGRVAKHVLPRRAYDLYIGLDNSTVMLRAFETRYRSRSAEQATPLLLTKGVIDDLPFRDGSVDAIVTSAVWLHNPKEIVRRSVAECLRVLKPGGTILVFGSFPNGINPASWQERINSEVFLPLRGRKNANGPVRTYAPEEIRSLFKSFKDVQVVAFGCRVVPNHLLVLPRILNWYTWKQLALPLNRLACRLLGGRMHMRFAVTIDVVAKK